MVIRGVVLLGVVLSHSLRAQDNARLREGQRVRVTTRSAKTPTVGSLIAISGDTLLLRTDQSSDPYRILRGDLVSVDTSKGFVHTGPGGLGGGIIGLGVGAVTGVIVGKLIANRDRARNRCPDGNCEFAELVTVPIGALVGFVAGGVIGSQLGGEEWDPVPWLVGGTQGPHHTREVGLAMRGQVAWLSR